MSRIWITAHSGCEGTPDNSMASIFKGIELGADCVEIDIRMDERGGLWLTHDALENYSGVVPLGEALRVIAENGVAVNCDIKQEALLYPVLEAAEGAGIPRERLIFSGAVDVDLLRKDPSIVRRARIFLNLSQIYPHIPATPPKDHEEEAAYFDAHIDEIAALVRALGVECVNPTFRIMPHARIENARAHGIPLSLWTVNEEADQRALMTEDLVNMTTRNVSGALRARRDVRGNGDEYK